MKVGGYAFFNDAVFEGPVNFGLAEIATALSANQAKFQNKETEANFSSMKVGGYAFFNDAVFEGPVTFVLAEIAGAFHANEAKFQQQGNGSQLQQHEDPRRRLLRKCGYSKGR